MAGPLQSSSSLFRIATTGAQPPGGPRAFYIHGVTVAVYRRMVRAIQVFWINRHQFKRASGLRALHLADHFSLKTRAGGIEHGRGAFLCFGDLQSVFFQVLPGDTVLLGRSARVPS